MGRSGAPGAEAVPVSNPHRTRNGMFHVKHVANAGTLSTTCRRKRGSMTGRGWQGDLSSESEQSQPELSLVSARTGRPGQPTDGTCLGEQYRAITGGTSYRGNVRRGDRWAQALRSGGQSWGRDAGSAESRQSNLCHCRGWVRIQVNHCKCDGRLQTQTEFGDWLLCRADGQGPAEITSGVDAPAIEPLTPRMRPALRQNLPTSPSQFASDSNGANVAVGNRGSLIPSHTSPMVDRERPAKRGLEVAMSTCTGSDTGTMTCGRPASAMRRVGHRIRRRA